MLKPKTRQSETKLLQFGQKKTQVLHKPKVPSLKTLAHANSLFDLEGFQIESECLPSEKCCGTQLVRRTADLKDLFLTKSGSVKDMNSMGMPFGPKTSAFIVPAKNFDIADVEMDVLENYNVWSDIGRGTYAVVKFATRKASGQKVAIKVYEKQKIQDPMRQKSIKREIKILKQLKHPNIVELVEEISAEKNLYLVMEYVQGFSLQAHMMKQPLKRLEEPEAAEIFSQFMNGLAYCHRINVTHRDIKLENILLDRTRQVKIIDFGFSTISNIQNKKSYVYCGTPNYMAPEIIKKIDYAGPPVDIWAAGVLLFTIVTGAFPFSSTKESKVFKKILKKDFAIPDYVSYNCKQLIMLMLTNNPDQRITAEQVLEHSWVKCKGKIPGKALPHRGDSIDVPVEEDNY